MTSVSPVTEVRLVQGLASAGIAAPAFALAADLSSGGNEGRQMSIITMGFGLGIALGPLIAGIIVQLINADDRTLPFGSAALVYTLLGLAVELAHGGTPISFAIAGLVALVTAYSYVKLSVAFPSQGGTVTFLERAFGPGLLTGSLNILLWLSYIVMLSLYGAARLSYIMAKDGELPALLEKKIWNEPLVGLLITAIMTLLIVFPDGRYTHP